MAKRPEHPAKPSESGRTSTAGGRSRNWTVIGALAAALVIILVAAYTITSREDDTGVAAGATPRNLSGPYNVIVGDPDAPTTLKMYEDLQCPICRDFEAVTGKQTRAALEAGKVKIDYHPVSFLDRMSSTAYSSRALNAAMAVLSTAGPDAFLEFRTIAFEGQPAEHSAGLPDSTLVDWAVKSGADEAEVTPLIERNTYHPWVVNATDQMSKDGITGTPTVFINGEKQDSNSANAAARVLEVLK